MIGKTQGQRVSITGLGAYAPKRVLTNDELSTLVDTSDEWIMERTGIRERRIAAPEQALTDLALPAARAALAQAGVEARDIDLLLCATVTPDMMFPTSSALLADTLGASDAAAYDLLAGCTGFMYALAQAYGMMAAGLSERALVVGGDVLSRILDWTDRSTLVLLATGQEPWCSRRSRPAASSASNWALTAAVESTCPCRAAAPAASTMQRRTASST